MVPTKRITDDLRARIDAHPFWYHTMELAPGVVTPGWFDLRPVVPVLPWPDVAGKRCLDIGTFDGHLAFEMEARGAAEVVAIDIEDHDRWDWPPDARPGLVDTTGRDAAFGGARKGDGFRLAAEALGSEVQWRAISIYDLDPAEVGTFDVVVCGSLLLHLRDPLRALEAVRGVCSGWFLSSEELDLWLTVLLRRRPVARFNGSGPDCQWFTANAAGHRRMVFSAGFEVVETSPPYVVAFNRHPKPPHTLRAWTRRLATAGLTRSVAPGVLHRAVLGRPRVGPFAGG